MYKIIINTFKKRVFTGVFLLCRNLPLSAVQKYLHCYVDNFYRYCWKQFGLKIL